MPFNRIDLVRKIKEHKIIPKPGWEFKLKKSIIKLITISSIVLFIFLIGSVLFLSVYQAKVLNAREVLTAKIFLKTLPWNLIVLSLMLLIFIQWVLSKTTKIYRKAILTVSLMLLVGLIGVSVLANQTTLFKKIYDQKSPLANFISKESQTNFNKHIKEGTIYAIENGVLTIKLDDQSLVYAKEKAYTRGRSGNNFIFNIGDKVILAILDVNGQKEVIKVRPVNDNCQNEINSEKECNNIQKGRKEKEDINNVKKYKNEK